MILRRQNAGSRDGFNPGGVDGVKRELGRLAPVCVPPGLRPKTLERAARARGNVALTPALRLAAALCLALIAALLLADPIVGRRQASRLEAVLAGGPASGPSERLEPELAEILGPNDSAVAGRARYQLRAAAAARLERERRLAEARHMLKGWLDNEDTESLI